MIDDGLFVSGDSMLGKFLCLSILANLYPGKGLFYIAVPDFLTGLVVFYHRILKCFVLIDLKSGEVQHEDIGQMNFYPNYYREEMNTEGDTEPIGIVLGAYQYKLVMQYALQGISNQVFVSHYQLYLPQREQLEAEFHRFLEGTEK